MAKNITRTITNYYIDCIALDENDNVVTMTVYVNEGGPPHAEAP